MDKHETEHLIKKKTKVPNNISIGVTWIDGRIVFKLGKKWANIYIGVCHFTDLVWAATPLDYDKPTMITTIQVSPFDKYCERAHTCLCFECKLNRFDKGMFIEEFKDAGAFSLGLPQNIGKKPLWFNDGKWKHFWGRMIAQMKPEGGIMKYDPNRAPILEK